MVAYESSRIIYKMDPLLKFVLVVSLIMNLYLLNYSDNLYDEYDSGCDTCKMLNAPEFGIDGYYVPGEYICYWVKDRTQAYINETILHEECHHLVYSGGYDHFCLETPSKPIRLS